MARIPSRSCPQQYYFTADHKNACIGIELFRKKKKHKKHEQKFSLFPFFQLMLQIFSYIIYYTISHFILQLLGISLALCQRQVCNFRELHCSNFDITQFLAIPTFFIFSLPFFQSRTNLPSDLLPHSMAKIGWNRFRASSELQPKKKSLERNPKMSIESCKTAEKVCDQRCFVTQCWLDSNGQTLNFSIIVFDVLTGS